MKFYPFIINVPILKEDDFKNEVLSRFDVFNVKSSITLNGTPEHIFDTLGDEYLQFRFLTSDLVNIYLLGRYVHMFNI